MAETTERPLPATIRAFIALPVGEPVREALASVQRDWARRMPKGSVRWTPPEQIHLTLKFLGEIPSLELPALESALDGAIATAAALRLATAGLGCFPSERDPRVLWVGLSGDLPPLLALQGRIEEAMSPWVPKEGRPFHAHLTLGRMKPGNGAGAARQAVRDGVQHPQRSNPSSWTADRVELIRSELGPEGARYTVLRAWPLRHGELPAN